MLTWREVLDPNLTSYIGFEAMTLCPIQIWREMLNPNSIYSHQCTEVFAGRISLIVIE